MKSHFILAAATVGALLALSGTANAQQSPTGIWIDHTGRGAVEITECGPALCGRLVWLKDAKNQQACGTQILGNVKPISAGVWDKGWIYDPEADSKYDVELKPVGPDKLRVLGYMGSKFLSETMMWKRAPADIQKCTDTKSAAAAPAPVPAPATGSASNDSNASGNSSNSAPVAKAPADPAPAPAPSEAKPAPYDQADSSAATEDNSDTKPRKDGKRRTAQKECRLDLPYIRVTYRCVD
jgi:uncharacterized protein (DUF2147 family)